MGFISAGLFYGTISSFFRFFVQNNFEDPNSKKTLTVDTPFQLASWFENIILLCYMFLVLISIGMGKSLDNPKVQLTLIGISIILCGFNFFVIIFALAKLFDSVLSFLILIAFLLTYIVPPILYDTKDFFLKIHKQILGIFSYILCMPLYLIVF